MTFRSFWGGFWGVDPALVMLFLFKNCPKVSKLFDYAASLFIRTSFPEWLNPLRLLPNPSEHFFSLGMGQRSSSHSMRFNWIQMAIILDDKRPATLLISEPSQIHLNQFTARGLVIKPRWRLFALEPFIPTKLVGSKCSTWNIGWGKYLRSIQTEVLFMWRFIEAHAWFWISQAVALNW